MSSAQTNLSQPLSPAAAPLPQVSPSDDANAAAGRVLVVDDDLSNRESLSRRLTRRGYSVASAADGSQALSMIERETFDLVLLDVMMPGISGLEVLQRVRQRFSSTQLPIIMATAKDQSEDVVQALDMGANDYVTKPLDFPVVLARSKTQLLLRRSVQQVLDLEKHLSLRNQELQEANARLLESAQRTKYELVSAAKVQAAFLPTAAPTVKGARFAWAFEPCQELAGDSLNVFAVDEEHLAFYVLDVSGHGVAASLLAVAATRLLSLTGDADSIVVNSAANGQVLPATPAEVAQRLNQRLPWNPATSQYLTLFYALYDTRTRQLSYTSAGHPPAVVLSADGSTRTMVGSDLPIGVGEGYHLHSLALNAGDRVYLYSDGVTEAMNPQRELFGDNRLVESLKSEAARGDLQASVQAVLADLHRWRAEAVSADDISILAMECRDE